MGNFILSPSIKIVLSAVGCLNKPANTTYCTEFKIKIASDQYGTRRIYPLTETRHGGFALTSESRCKWGDNCSLSFFSAKNSIIALSTALMGSPEFVYLAAMEISTLPNLGRMPMLSRMDTPSPKAMYGMADMAKLCSTAESTPARDEAEKATSYSNPKLSNAFVINERSEHPVVKHAIFNCSASQQKCSFGAIQTIGEDNNSLLEIVPGQFWVNAISISPAE